MRIRTLISAAALALSSACGADEAPDAAVVETPPVAATVEVIARDLTLEAPDTVPPGWTTVRFTNTSPMIHFVAIEKMPEGTGLVEQQAEVAPVFQEGFELLAAGEVDAALAAFGTLPPWFSEVVFMGGPGLTSPGLTSETTIYLEPGTYLLECYVKTDGVFHSYNPEPGMYGMVHELTVAGEPSSAPEPEATLRLAISSEGGITMDGAPTPGPHTVAVDFGEQQVHQNFVGHDVHLMRREENTDMASVERWMDWTLPEGLQTPAPAQFLGGTNEMPSGTISYFDVMLEPGSYAWIAEVPGAAAKGMLVRFEVPDG